MSDVKREVRESRLGLVYSIRGAGRPVLLVHGWCLDRTVWLYQEQALLAAGFTVLAVDLAGYGESTGLSGPFPLERHGGDVADLVEELGLHDVVAVGFAFGAAVLLSLPRYDRLSRAVLIGVPSAASAPYPKMRSAMLRDWPRFAHNSAKAICSLPHSDESLAWLGDVFARTPLGSALAGVDTLAEFEPLELSPGGRCPLIFVHGSEDPIVPSSISERAAVHFSDATIRLVPGSGHFVPWDGASDLSAIIDEIAAESAQ